MKKLLLLALTLLMGVQAQAAVPTSDMQYLFNRLPGSAGALARKYALGTVLREAHSTMTCTYDFATQGGAVGSYTLKDTAGVSDCSLPAKAIVRSGLIDVTTAFGAGTTVKVGLATNNDLKTVINGGSFTAAKYDVIPVGTAATAIKLTLASGPQITFASGANTAGHMRLFLDYVLGE